MSKKTSKFALELHEKG